ncbi:MAG: peptidoglycan editing factor PgeF [Chlorobiaceae bacterium]
MKHTRYTVPALFARESGVVALESTRNGGVSEGAYASLNLGNNTGDLPERVSENTSLLALDAGIDPKRLVSSVQVHGTQILKAEAPGHYHGYDAFITSEKELYLCILTADCYPVLIYDPRHPAVGAAHAGWKGSAGEIVRKTVEAMHREFSTQPSECLAYIGTGISGAAYEVDKAVAEAFRPEFSRPSPRSGGEKKCLLDLQMVNFRQLTEAGIPAAQIARSSWCSSRDRELFFSYRRDNGDTGRMLTLIGLRSG